MADILIKNMEMPKYCNYCPMYDDEYCQCRLEPSYDGHWTRENGCPLVELPPHGRLIDADELEKAVEKMVVCDSYEYTIAHQMIKGLLKIAPTIMEAST